MKLAPLQGFLQQLGRVNEFKEKNVNRLSILSRATVLAVAVPIMVPFGSLPATNQVKLAHAEESVFEVDLVLSEDEQIVRTPLRQVEIEITESPYQAKQREMQERLRKQKAEEARRRAAEAAEAQKTAPAKPTGNIARSADPSLEEKRIWVQQAAGMFGIDWKLLEAVWQIESGKRWQSSIRSYAGAQGPCQFMPGTWRAYAHDGNGDGIKDVNDARDCLFASAKLLARNGASSGDEHRALFAYNRSNHYVNTVLGIARSIN